jgi:hypothetical protein
MKIKHPKEYKIFLKEVRDYIDCIRISDLAKVLHLTNINNSNIINSFKFRVE